MADNLIALLALAIMVCWLATMFIEAAARMPQ
jgi:hypothetical protein